MILIVSLVLLESNLMQEDFVYVEMALIRILVEIVFVFLHAYSQVVYALKARQYVDQIKYNSLLI